MISNGLEEEARKLHGLGHLNALNSVGYKEFFEYFDGKIPRERVAELIKRNTRRFAKRQLTWWAKDNEIHWFYPQKYEKIIEFIESKIS